MQKKLTKHDWKMIGDFFQGREDLITSAKVEVHGQLITADKLSKEIARYKNEARVENSRPGELPEGVRILNDIPELSRLDGPQVGQDLDEMIVAHDEDERLRPQALHFPPGEVTDLSLATTVHSPARSPFPFGHWDSPAQRLILEDPPGAELWPFNNLGQPAIDDGYCYTIADTTTDIMSDNFRIQNIVLPGDTLSMVLSLSAPLFGRLNGLSQQQMTFRYPESGRARSLISRRAQQALKNTAPHKAFLCLVVHLLMNNFSEYADVESEELKSIMQQLEQLPKSQIQMFLKGLPHPYYLAVEKNLLYLSVGVGPTSVVQALLGTGSIDTKTTTDLLLLACESTRPEIVQSLLKSVDAKYIKSMGPKVYPGLSRSLENSHFSKPACEIMSLLIKAGVTLRLEDVSDQIWENDICVESILKHAYMPPDNIISRKTVLSLTEAIRQRTDEEAVKALRIFLGDGSKSPANMETNIYILDAFAVAETNICIRDAFAVAVSARKNGVCGFLIRVGAALSLLPSLLVEAIRLNSIQIISDILRLGVAPNILVRQRSNSRSNSISQECLNSDSDGEPSWSKALARLRDLCHTTPFAEAIRRQNPVILELLGVEEALQALSKPGKDCKQYEDPLSVALCAASEVGDLRVVQRLLALTDSSQCPPLHGVNWSDSLTFAMLGNFEPIVDVIIEAGIRPSHRLLEASIIANNPRVLRLCLDAGLAPGQDYEDLRNAVRLERREMISDLINSDTGDTRTEKSFVSCGCTYHTGSGHHLRPSALGIALYSNDQPMIDLLVRHGQVLERRCSCDLRYAVQSGSEEAVRRMLLHGAKPDNEMVLLDALEKGTNMLHIITKALSTTARRGGIVGIEALFRAVERADIGAVKLLAAFTDINSPKGYAGTVFGTSIAKGNAEIIEALLELGGDLKGTVQALGGVPRVYGRWTALLKAIKTEDLRVVKQIVHAGADVNCPVGLGILRTPLQLAAELGCLDIVEYLLDQKADVNGPPCLYGGGTALQITAIKGWVGIAEVLLEKGADINAPRGKYQGRTAFEGAAEHGRLDMLLFLFRNRVNLVSDGGEQIKRAMAFAERNGKPAAKSLVQQIANEIALGQLPFSAGPALGQLLY
jgi:ankyrin repeat protein